VASVEQWEEDSEPVLAVCALLFLGAYAWPILDPGLPSGWQGVCRWVNYIVWAVFIVDYVVRVSIARQRGSYVVRHVPDLLMIALPVLRPLRLLRVVMLLRFVNRQATDSLRGRVAFYVGGSTVLVLFCAALAVLDAERHSARANIISFGDALWWAITTMSTVGYGDRYPVTTEGRFVAGALMLTGVALIGVVTASIASWLIDRVREVEAETQAATRDDIAALRDEIQQLRAVLDGTGVQTLSD
jgi:voltage-gated potassium channel